MSTKKTILLIPLLLVSTVAGIIFLPTVHAATGTVCLNDPSNTSTSVCPSSPYVFNGPFPSTPQPGPTQIRVGVYVSASDGLNAFDITLNTTSTVLRPVGADLTGTVLLGSGATQPSIVLLCVGGSLIAGTVCAKNDTVSTLHVAAASAPGAPLTTAPTSGLLFTAIFNITSATASGGVPVGFGAHCGSQTSAADGSCVTIANGTHNADLETLQAATFDNSANNVTWFAITANVSSTSSLLGAGVGNHVAVNATIENGGPPLLGTTAVTFQAVVSQGFVAPNFAGNPTATCTPTPGTPCTVVLTFSTAKAGTYDITVYGRYVGDDCGGSPSGPCLNSYTLAGTVTIIVNIEDVGWTVAGTDSSASQTMYFTPSTFNIPYTFTSLGGYAGTLTLGTSICSPQPGTGITCPANPPAFTLSAFGTITKLINFTATGYGKLTLKSTLSATGLPGKSSGTFSVLISQFSMVSNSTSVTFASGSTAHVGVTLTSQGAVGLQFAGKVTLGSTVSPAGLSVACSPPSVTLTANGQGSSTCTLSASLQGSTTFALVITGTGGTDNEMTGQTSTITVTVLGSNDFTVTANPTSVPVPTSTAGTSTITVAAVGTFNGGGTFTVTTNSSNLVCTISPGTFSGSSGSSTLSCQSTTVGNYQANVTVTSNFVHFVLVTYHILPPPDFAISANPTAVNASPASPGTSTITVSPLYGFTGAVTLGVTTNSTNISCTLTPASISGGSGQSSLSCSVTVTSGHFAVNVTGTSGALHHSVILVYTATQLPDFTITSSTGNVATNAGVAGTATITVTAQNGFTGTVGLSTNDTTHCAVTPSSVAGSGGSTLSCTFGSAGNFGVKVTGVSGSLSHSVIVGYTVQDFSLAASAPPTVVVTQSATSTITISPVNGFTGTVGLTFSVSTSSGLTCTLLPASITPSTSASLQCTTVSSGVSNVTVTGTIGSLVRSVVVKVTVSDFSITTYASPLSMVENSTATISLTLQGESNFDGTVSLTASTVKYTGVAPTFVFSINPVHVTDTPTTITLTITLDKTVKSQVFAINVTGTFSTRSQKVPITTTIQPPNISIVSSPASIVAGPGGTGHSTITFSSVNGLYSRVNATLASAGGASCSIDSTSFVLTRQSPSATATLTCTGGIGSHTVNISAVGVDPGGDTITAAPQGSATFVVADFTVTHIPDNVLINTGQTGHARITISWASNYNGVVTFKLIPSAGLNASLETSSLTGSGNVTVDVASNTANVYTLTVNATSGNVYHTVSLTVTVTAVQPAPTIFGLDPTTFYAIIGVVVVAVIGGIVVVVRRGRK